MKAVVTGGTGYIGGKLVERLRAEGHSVLLLKRGQSISEMTSLMSDFQAEVVFHLASLFIAEHKSEQVADLIDSNIKFGSFVLEAMAMAKVKKMVNVGSTWQHYEESPYRSVSLYSATKSAFENIVDYYCDSFGIKQIHVRITDSYGPNDSRGKIVSSLIQSFRIPKTFNLSAGEQFISLVHVDDIVSGLIQAESEITKLESVRVFDSSRRSRRFTLAATDSIQLKQLVHLIESLAEKKLDVNLGALPYRKREVMKPQVLDPVLPNWTCKVDLKAGLAKLIESEGI